MFRLILSEQLNQPSFQNLPIFHALFANYGERETIYVRSGKTKP